MLRSGSKFYWRFTFVWFTFLYVVCLWEYNDVLFEFAQCQLSPHSSYWWENKGCLMDSLYFESMYLRCKLWFKMKNTTQRVGYFKTISGHCFGNYIHMSHKTEVLAVILMRLTYLNPYRIKNYDIKHNFCHIKFFSIL